MAAIRRYLAPQSVAEATQDLAHGSASIFAGGTDLMLQARSRAKQLQPVLMNIRRIGALRGISESDGQARIGSLTTITDILENGLLRDVARVLVETANCFGSDQVRNTATLGGNICTASPAGDMIIPLLLLDAQVELASWKNGEVVCRKMPVCEFFVGPGRTRIQPHELLTFIRFAVPEAGALAVFGKFGTRPALDIAVASVGIAGVKRNGCLRRARVAFGAVAPTPSRGPITEGALEGAILDEDRISSIARAAEEEVSPISDVRASAWYRKRIIHHLTRRLLHDVSRRED